MSTNPFPAQVAATTRRARNRAWEPVVAARVLGRGALYLALILASVAMIFPFLWMVLTSLKPEAEVVRFPPQLWPDHVTMSSYVDIWARIPFARFFLNSVIFATSVTALSLVLDSMTAYALARLRFPGRDVIFLLILALLMVPFQVTLIPLFNLVFQLGWLNTYAGLIIGTLLTEGERSGRTRAGGESHDPASPRQPGPGSA